MPDVDRVSACGCYRHLCRRVVVVYGAPASDKTTIASAISAHFSLPMFEQDSFKEALTSALPGSGRAWSRELGAASYAILLHTAQSLCPLPGWRGTGHERHRGVPVLAGRSVGRPGCRCRGYRVRSTSAPAGGPVRAAGASRRARRRRAGRRDAVAVQGATRPLPSIAAYHEINTEQPRTACIQQAVAAVSGRPGRRVLAVAVFDDLRPRAAAHPDPLLAE